MRVRTFRRTTTKRSFARLRTSRVPFTSSEGWATQMGAVIVDPKRGKQKVLEFKDGMLRMFDIPNDQIRLIKAGSNQGQMETFLTLGFGGSGKDLARAWNITYGGSETLIGWRATGQDGEA